jgi:hypothetical protein
VELRKLGQIIYFLISPQWAFLGIYGPAPASDGLSDAVAPSISFSLPLSLLLVTPVNQMTMSLGVILPSSTLP